MGNDWEQPPMAPVFEEPRLPCRRYPSDLTDALWAVLGPLVPAPKPGDRPLMHPRREIIDAVHSVLRNGGTWRSLPRDLPPWQTGPRWRQACSVRCAGQAIARRSRPAESAR